MTVYIIKDSEGREIKKLSNKYNSANDYETVLAYLLENSDLTDFYIESQADHQQQANVNGVVFIRDYINSLKKKINKES